MNDIYFLPEWLTDNDTAEYMQHIMDVEERRCRYHVHPLSYDSGHYAIIDASDDQFVTKRKRTGAVYKANNILKFVELKEAIGFCDLINQSSQRVEESLTLSQRIMYIADRERVRAARNVPQFYQCEGCLKMVKKGHKCPQT